MLGYRSEMELFMHRVIRSKKCFSLKGLEREIILENHSFFRKRKMDLFPLELLASFERVDYKRSFNRRINIGGTI